MGGEAFQFEVQASLTGGESWTSDYVLIWAQPGTVVEFAVRTRMTISTGQTEGWSFSLHHDPSSIQSAGGNLTVVGVSTEGTDTQTVKNGSPPDFEDSDIEAPSHGYTQGVVIDMDAAAKLSPCTDFVTSVACYEVTAPTVAGYYEVPISFTHDLGDPPIDSIVVQEGRPIEACAYNLAVGIYVSSFHQDYPSCAAGGGEPLTQGQPGVIGLDEESGSPSVDFVRGDPNADGSINIGDAIFVLSYLFSGGPCDCKDAADINDDERIDISDPIALLGYLFGGGPPPPPPFGECGLDLTGTEDYVARADDLIHCAAYTPCGNTIDTDNDGLPDYYEQQFGTSPNVRDTDGDGFTDGEEVLSTGVEGTDGWSLTINSTTPYNCDPTRPDIFVEVDFMYSDSCPHGPNPQGLKLVQEAFARRGFALHIDAGCSGPDYNFDLGGANKVPHLEWLSERTWGEPAWREIWSTVEDFKAQYMDPARFNVFHYCLLVHLISPLQDHPEDIVSGMAQGIFADDFVMRDTGTGDPVLLFGGRFMHELGHTLGLRHMGGWDEPRGCPNYVSVMSHAYTHCGIDIDCDHWPDGVLDYSDKGILDIITLDESRLYEPRGYCKIDPPVPCDWNQNGFIEQETLPPFNITRDCFGNPVNNTTDDLCQPYDDWAHLRLDFRNSPNRNWPLDKAEPEVFDLCPTDHMEE